MAKNILLIDRAAGINNESFVEHVLDDTDVCIPVLVVEDSAAVKQKFINNKRIGRVFSVKEIDTYNNPSGIDFEIILQGRVSKSFIESALLRYIGDYNERKYICYMGLSFWNQIFTENSFDIIINNGYIHGFSCDGHLLTFAKRYNIPLIATHMYGLGRFNRSFQELVSMQMIRLKNESVVEDISQYVSWDEFNYTYKEKSHNHQDNSITNKVRKMLKKQIGPLGIEIIESIRYRNFHHKVFCDGTGFYTDTAQKIKSYISLMLTKQYLDKVSVRISNSAPYIYYSLHMEPEATIQFLTLESQLVAIQMLSSSLPNGWRIYVKEHPHQFSVNCDFLYYYTHNIDFFKTKNFYKKILEMKNVEIVSRNYDSEIMVENAVAVASLSGTVLLESVIKRKPVLLFSEMHPLVHDSNVLKCFSFKQCVENMYLLKKGYIPNYEKTLLILNKYLTSNRDDFFKNLSMIIKQYT